MPECIVKPFVLFCLLGVVLTLGACGPGGNSGGYANRTWDYNRSVPHEPAQQAPNPLSGIYEGTPSPASETSTAEAPQWPVESEYNQVLRNNDDNLPPVKVALLLPLSGQHKALGEAMLQAAQIALFDAGYAGFELLPRDTRGTADGAREAAQSAIQDGAQLVLGPVFAASVQAARPVTQRARVNMIAFSTDWGLAGGGTYIMGFLPFDQIERVLQYASDRKIKRIGVIAPQTEYGHAVIAAYNAMAPRYGIYTADTMTFSPQSNNLAPALRQFTRYDQRTATQQNSTTSGASPLNTPLPFDAVLMPTGGEQASAIGNLLSHYDLPPNKVKRLGTGLFDDPGLAPESSLAGSWFAAPSPALRESFERHFVATYGYSAPRLASLAYDATALSAVLARRGLRETGRPAFDQAAISNPNGFAGIDGIFRFRPDGTAERGLAVLEYRHGRIRMIDDAPETFVKGSNRPIQ
ncbi:MAG: penicillin-binding protein activator [Alphaproteobacteria bacterium]|nr:penicillin-binding protein activator [Alphaproteobacteria bacterium]